MKRRASLVLVGLIVMSGHQFARVHAQSAAAPQAYSFTMTNAMFGPPVTIKIYRDGARELVDRLLPAGPGITPSHYLQLYDFQAGTAFQWDLLDAQMPCSKSTTTDKATDSMVDPISGVAEWMANIDSSKSKPAGNEVVNGVATRVLEVVDPASKISAKLWQAEKGNYVIKYVMTPPGGPTRVLVEIKMLSFDKPPASTFAMPAKCNGIAVTGNFTTSSGSSVAGAPPAATAAPSSPSPASPPSPASAPSASAAAMAVPIRINAGGPAQRDTAGILWEADKGFNGGNSYQNTNAPVVAPATGGKAPNLFQTERYSENDFSYSFDVPDGSYKVRLRFAEIYFKDAGQRVMSVDINDKRVLDHFDILAAANGPNIPVDKEFPVQVTTGKLVIHFIKVVQNPKVSAIEIVKAP
jgi:Malectin domain